MMDELEPIKRFRAAEAEPSEAAQQHARSILDRAIAAESRRPTEHPWWRRGLRPRALLLSAGGVVAAVATIVLLGLSGSSTGPTPAAAAVLERLARVVAIQSFTPHRGQYLYVESVSTNSEFEGSCQVLRPDHRQIWIGANGSGLLRESFGQGSFTSPADRARCAALPGPPSSRVTQPGGASNLWFAAHCFTLGPTSDWSSLSSNPHTLLHQMRRIDGGPRTHAEDFVHVGDFLRETDAPGRVRAALYRAAALIPGVQLLGWVKDHYGRKGLGIAYTAKGSTSELIFNSRTGELLGEQSTGPLKGWSVYLHQQIVDHPPGHPPAPLKPPCIRTAGTVKHTPHGDVMVGTGHGPNSQPDPAQLPMSILQRGALGPILDRRFARELSTGHLSVHQLNGVPHVLIFWASKCSPCQQDAPLLERAWHSSGRPKGILFVGIDTADTTAHALSFLHKARIDYLQLSAPPFSGFAPATDFVTATGKMVAHVDGLINAEQLAHGIRALAHSH